MKNLKRLFLCLGLAAVLSASALASDCETITAQWFGSDGSDGSVLELETVDVNGDITAALETYAQEQEAIFTAETAAWSRTLDRTALIMQLEQRINAIITDAAVTTLVTDVEETENGYIAAVYEWVFFDYDDLADGEGGSDTAGFGAEHTMTFEYDEAGQLVLVADEYVESDVLTGEIPTENVYDEAETLGMLPVTNPSYVETYDPVKAILYADQWVSHEDLDGGEDPSFYNPAYNAYHNVGGDCSNYVSQCLCAGGMVPSGSWVPDNYVWINCQGQHFHFWNNGKTIANPEAEDIYPGSPIYYWGYTHVTICVGYNSAGTPVVNGHTTDRYRVPWDYSKDTIAYTLQLTAYRLEDTVFAEDSLIAGKECTVNVYSFFRDETAKTSMKMKQGDSVPVAATFTLDDTQWAAINYEDAVCYVKLEDSLVLASQGLLVTLSDESVTTNDYLTVSAELSEDTVTKASVSIGSSGDIEMTVKDGKATLTLDCQNFTAGEKQIKVTVQGQETGQWVGTRKFLVTEENTASGKGWNLDKETGYLTILSDVDNAAWLRFAKKIKTAEVSAAVTALPEGAFEGCGLTAIYGSQAFLEELAEELNVEFIYDAFLDVSPSDWYFDHVNAAVKAGAFYGITTTEFVGEGTMTRSMFVSVLARISGEDLTAYEKAPFTDVPENTWYTKGVAWGYGTGIAVGVSDTEFAPEANVTREQALTMIGRFISYYGVELADAEETAKPFVDESEISAWAKKDVEAMRLKGIAQGTPEGEFQPTRSMSRAEAAAFVMRLVRAIGDQELTPPEAESIPETEE